MANLTVATYKNLAATIQRMARNSLHCKIYVLVFVIINVLFHVPATSAVITITCSGMLLDAYYLSLERKFCKQVIINIKQIVEPELTNAKPHRVWHLVSCLNSPSIYLFYAPLIFIIIRGYTL